MADSDDEARAIWRESGYCCGHEWFEPFGFSKGLDDPKTGEPADLWTNGLAFVGTVDTVTRQVEHLLKRLPIRWVFAWMYNGLMPHDRLMKTIELFWTKVLPRVANISSRLLKTGIWNLTMNWRALTLPAMRLFTVC